MSISSRLRGASSRRAGHRLAAGIAGLASIAGFVAVAPSAAASSVTSASFGATNAGATDVATVNSKVYAKQGASLTLTVNTSSDTQCVDVAGAFTGHQQSSTPKSSWTFTTTAGAGDGAQTVTATASVKFNAQNICSGASGSAQASYTLDNTAPAVTGKLSATPNAAGWVTGQDATVTWSATDTGGSGVPSGPTPASSSETSNGKFTETSTATDAVGNVSKPVSVNLWIDSVKPTILATQVDNKDGTVTVTFSCTDATSLIASCAADSTSPASASRTVTAGTTVSGTATDNAGNTATTSVVAKRADSTAPTITHTVSPTPNDAGWNKADATVTFNCADETGGSGLATCAADGTSPSSNYTKVSTETNGTLVSGTATDNAGNKATDSVTVKVDKTLPTISASADRAANTAGWYNNDVTVSFECDDPGTQASGVKSCPVAKTLSTDGANQSVSGTATDNADNTSAAASVTGISIDKTAPVLTATYPTTWQNGDVTVKWNCTDPLSGPAGQPADSVVTGEGSNLTATARCTDLAGNTTTKTVNGIQIDRHAPVTGISGTSNNWTNGNVSVTLSPTDNLSGVASTTYSIDGGSPQTGTTFTLSTEGDHTISYFSTDNAGNSEAPQTAEVKIDKTAPTIGHVFDPTTYTDGAWTNQDVKVAFNCADQGGSGVASCTGGTTVTTEGEAQQVAGVAADGAGNTATDTAVVSIDKTKPTIVASADRASNTAGWYNKDVNVSFACDDKLSGIASCPAAKTLSEGSNQAASGTATDKAGNSATGSVSGINIDETAPTLTGSFSSGWHTGDVTVSWSCTDALSGPTGQPANSTVPGEGSNLSATATCSDNAGNTVTKTVSGIEIDRHAPATFASVSGQLKNGWYNAATSFTLAASDNLSGVAETYYAVDGGSPQVYSGAVTITDDGTHTVTYWSVDNAGNVEDKTGNSITLQLDHTPPTLSGAVTTVPGRNGWFTGDVNVHWTCSDTGSGLDGNCPSDSTVTGEGANLTASASVSDLAGNSTSKTISGIKIDRSAPTTTASVPTVPASGWYTGPVQVTLTGFDALSGVDTTYYTIDNGVAQTYNGPFSFSTEGTHTVSFWSMDKAGNIEIAGAPITLKIDQVPPTTTVIDPISPDSGWFVTSGIPFAFAVSDDASGIAATYYTIDGGAPQTYGKPFTADLSTGSHAVTYWSVDLAGNQEPTQKFTINLDTIPPTITGDTVNTDGSHRSPNGYGWFNSPVNVKFSCADVGSGINGVAGCAGDTTLVNDGAGQIVHGDAVDVAGNTSSTDFGPVNIDQTKPTLVGVPDASNAAGWHNKDVTVTWVGKDALSNIDPLTQPANSVITGEGSNLGAGPVTISDKAGNVSEQASVTGIKIDRTAPVITGGPTTQPNGAGWYTSDVIVDFKCTDPSLADGTAGSGVASCPTSKLIHGDGANQSVTSDPATDAAGNISAGKTVGGINIDGTAPATTANNQCTKVNGYCTGSTANVVLTATDQAGLSGVKEIHYVVNGGTEQVRAGSTTTVSVPLDGSGNATVKYWAVDNADNVETPNSVSLNYDNIAPTVTHVLSPAANAAGWNNSDVTVTFSAKDDDAGSGVDPSTLTTPVTVSTETSGQLITGSAKDTAGNLGTDSVNIRLDKTKPTITAAITGGTKGNNGWYIGPVTVTFSCSDDRSGVATCPDPVVLTSNGSAQTASGTATDNAGNTASATLGGINIDQEKPTLTTANVNVQGATYTLGSVPAAACTATDSFSGLASCTVSVSGGNSNGVGTFSYAATATDKAGNTSTVTGSYKVIYRWDGFLQPINDTAHQTGLTTSVFKAGSTVPAKFQLKNSAGTVVQAVSAPAWLTPVKGSSTSAPVDESVYTATADSGSDYKYDSTAQQYIYNWKSGSTGGSYWRIGVTLDDGQTYYVNIGLR